MNSLYAAATVAIIVCNPGAVAAQAKSSFVINRVVPAAEFNSSSVTVYPTSGKLPDATTLTKDGAWTVIVYGVPPNQQQTAVLHPAQVKIDSANPPGFITLETGLSIHGSDPNNPTLAKQIFVLFSSPTGNATGQWPAPPPPKQAFAGAKTADDANINVSFSYSPAIGSPPQYSIDASTTLMFGVGKTGKNYFGFAGAAKTDNRKIVDPDSFSASFIYDRVLWAPPLMKPDHINPYSASSPPSVSPFEGLNLNVYMAGVEFDRKANNLNYVSAAYVTLPLRLAPFGLVTYKSKLFLKLTPLLGFETGANITNAVTNNGLGWLARGYGGADATLLYNFPENWVIKAFTVTSSYRIRIPARDEVFTLTRTNPTTGKAMDDPFLTRKARNHVKSEMDLKFNDWFSIAIKDEYGELPPAFRFVDNSVSVGLKVMLQETGSLKGALVTR